MKSLPKISLTILKDKPIIPGTKEFLKISRNWFEINYPDKTKSEPILLDFIDRIHNDAVVIIAWSEENNEQKLYLRSCVRPALHKNIPEHVNLWEFAAGLVEDGENPKEAAARECLEELGFDIPASEFSSLGEYVIPVASIFPERIFFYHVMVDPSKQGEPTLDGSPLERFGVVDSISLKKAMKLLITNNPFRDSKTELGIYRFFSYIMYDRFNALINDV